MLGKESFAHLKMNQDYRIIKAEEAASLHHLEDILSTCLSLILETRFFRTSKTKDGSIN